MIDSFSVHRPIRHAQLWKDLFSIIEKHNGIVLVPDCVSLCTQKVIKHVPKDILDSFSLQVVLKPENLMHGVENA